MTEETTELPVWFWPLFPVLFVGLWCVISYLLAWMSGWRRLAAHYSADLPVGGQRFRFRSAQTRLVRFNHCLNFAATPAGLHLWLLLPFRLGSPPLLVPWTDLSATTVRRFLLSGTALGFARAPKVKIRISTALGEQIAAASRGALRITPA
jgi:hypothetical protein